MDRTQTISRGDDIFRERCCRLSYGVLVLEEYKPDDPKHFGQTITVDPRDGKKWVENQIDWFVKQVHMYPRRGLVTLLSSETSQGESVSNNGVLKPYLMKIKPGLEDRPWQTHVVMSTVPREQLPSSLDHDCAKRLCDVQSVLKDKGVDMKLKNRHWYNRGEKYLRAKFNLKVMVGAADLKSQLQAKNKTVLSDDHEAIQVKWEAPKPSAEDRNGLTSMYRA